MTLLETGKNRDLGNAQYAENRTAYRESTYEITRQLAEQYGGWTPAEVSGRQRWMAKQATTL